jgi:endonuclease/exonuclease/phosphatase family metal-dependent hydrolase
VYDYIPVIGPLFRDKFWLVHLLVGIVAAAPILLVRKERFPMEVFSLEHKKSAVLRGVLVGIAVAVLSAVFLLSAQPAAPAVTPTELRVLTYNIQQGYSEDGIKNYQGQLDLIRSLSPDIIGLQESDTNRIAGGNADIVRYFADQLDMYSYYGPSPVTGTFGIALLSKFPIEEVKTFYMYSVSEQTATIEARIVSDEIEYLIYVTHLGNSGPIIQQEQFLEFLEGNKNIIAMGDFNFRPDTDQYQLTIDVLDDAYIKSQMRKDADQFDPSNRIDHIFVSPEVSVEEAAYILSAHSDHPAMLAVISLLQTSN